MKRIVFWGLLIFVTLGSYAQKSYLFMNAGHYYDTQYNIRLSGDLPSGLKSSYNHKELGEMLNEISQAGFDLDYCFGESTINFVFSKGGSNYSSTLTRVKVDDEDVTEVARYNLQGIPVSSNTKGIQIIVYSNYTTKTVIVE